MLTLSLIKGTVNVISSDIPFKEGHYQFTTVPFKPLTDQGFTTVPFNLGLIKDSQRYPLNL